METLAEVVELTPAKNGDSRRRWQLELAADAVRVFDGRGKVVLTIDRDEANRRILFPSFWLSVKHIQIFEGERVAFEFLPDKEAMERIRAYLDVALRQDPSARKKLKQSGVAVFLLGLFLTIAGGGFLTVEIIKGTVLHPDRFRTSSPYAALLFGIGCLFWGVHMVRKAARLGREQKDDV
jgi:hypothetical protein